MSRSICWALMLPVCVILPGGCSPIQWERSYEQGLEQARQQRRRALVHVHSAMSHSSRQMDSEVFTDPEVQRLMANFVAIRLDQVLDRRIVEQLGVQVVPSFFVVRPDMSISASHAGKLDAEKFRVFLIRNLYD
jgi:thiol:disulfide interchange protein